MILVVLVIRKLEVRPAMAVANSDEFVDEVRRTGRNSHKLTSQLQSANEESAETGTPTAQSPVQNNSSMQALCLLKRALPTVPFGNGAQIFFAARRSSLGEDLGHIALVKDQQCHDEKYSIVYLDKNGRLEDEIDCRQVSLTELALRSSQQAAVIDVPSTNSTVNLAISGAGHFALNCPDNRISLTRLGKFIKTDDGQLTDEEGCILLNNKGLPFLGSEVNSSGCSLSNASECIAMLEPSVGSMAGLTQLNSYSYKAEHADGPELLQYNESSFKAVIISEALEDVKNKERDSTGVDWSTQPFINPDQLSCD